jgi:hypothetical protein
MIKSLSGIHFCSYSSNYVMFFKNEIHQYFQYFQYNNSSTGEENLILIQYFHNNSIPLVLINNMIDTIWYL